MTSDSFLSNLCIELGQGHPSFSPETTESVKERKHICSSSRTPEVSREQNRETQASRWEHLDKHSKKEAKSGAHEWESQWGSDQACLS